MYEELTFGSAQNAQRVSKDDSDDIRSLDVSVARKENAAHGEFLSIDGMGSGPHEVRVELVSGDVEMRNTVRNRSSDLTDSSVEVDDETMTVTVEAFGCIWTVVVGCEGETNNDDGPNLEQFGVDI